MSPSSISNSKLFFWFPWVSLAAIAGLLMIQPLRDFSFFNALPFVSSIFYIFFLSAVGFIYLLKGKLRTRVSYASVICTLNLVYIIFFFPDPFHAVIFSFYFYLVYYCLCVRSSPRYTKTAIFLALLPMIVSRSTAEVRFVGLSYMTFRAFHVMMDAQLLGMVGPFEFFTFLSFFPSITAGPIDRLQNFAQQLKNGFGSLNFANFTAGYQVFLVGAVMKFVFSELVMKLVVLEYPRDILEHVIGMYRYSAYLYFDFAGYSAMALGCALMIGIKLPENFNHPYLAQNPTDFWRRFHISLGEWLRDYFFKPLYKFFHEIPLLASRPLLRQNLALFLTFLLMGCWNGLKFNYVLSGSLFGLYSAAYNTVVHWRKVNQRAANQSRWAKIGSIVLTVSLCCFALYIFGGEYNQ